MALHYTMRESERKTVMAGKCNSIGGRISGGTDQTCRRRADRRSDQLFSVTYEELRRLASSVRRGDPSATLSPTALVNEAWMKLAKSPDVGATSRLHFKRIAARAMRQLLVEAARRRNSGKRGGGAKITVTFDDAFQKKPSGEDELLALNTALGIAGAHESAAGDDGGKPILRRAGCSGDGGAAERFGSHSTARLASGEGLADSRTSQSITADRHAVFFPFRPETDDGQHSLAESPISFSRSGRYASVAAARFSGIAMRRRCGAGQRSPDPARRRRARRLAARRRCGPGRVPDFQRFLLRPAPLQGIRTVPNQKSAGRRRDGRGVSCASARILGNQVAIKILRDAWVSPARRERFNAEQRTLAQLNHPSIARLYDADTSPDGTPFFVMEYVEGVPLTELLQDAEVLDCGALAFIPRRLRSGAVCASARCDSSRPETFQHSW